MDTQSTAQPTGGWNGAGQEIYDYLSEKLSFDPSIEPQAYNMQTHCSVAEAADLLGKSSRQVQRMLKDGQLKGYKTMGLRGPKWMVERSALFAPRPAASVENMLEKKLSILESKYELIASEVLSLKEQVERLERASMQTSITESTIEIPADFLQQRTATSDPLTEIFANSTDSGAPQQEQQPTVIAMTDQNAKRSWWHRAFAQK